ncbi:heparanase-like protein 2 [Phoenix dactylifera]|uniref:Heparanase-like protein 2 n=1 Tax=Phoenix dactylifera TaxID=42345 RepID=A0A8B7CRT1_PHODC|nr:heparanase-like protein 2 [Phoenix dactylifera]XP_008805084.2 heparanase-like protein 2 [Phoenix dactylifera]XP_008805085.2 heparanase-like protein 2 [Phoenix dactylifera]
MGGRAMGVQSSFLSILLFSSFSLGLGDMVTVTVKAVTTIAQTDDNFICATIDWWPKEKCNYNMCPWYNSSIINLDLNNTILFNAIKAFKSLRVRLGGSLQDHVVYKIGRKPAQCEDFKLDQNGLFGFSRGCLSKSRWDELNAFLNKTGAIITFGLNALAGRRKAPEGNLYIGDWDSANARKLIRYSVLKNYKIESWEFGNELSGQGVGASVDPKQYGKDLIALKKLIGDLYKNSSTEPKLLGPGGFFEAQWFADMLQTSGPGVVNGVTHHIYNLGAGVDKELIYRIQDPYYLYQIAQIYNDILAVIKDFGPWSSAWIGEAGGAYNSGGKDVSNTFANSFWYLDQLGMVSTFKHKVFCRQALIGGNYALLNTTTFIPNPDFYSALLWHRLMGPGVLHATHQSSPFLRAYAHCSKQKPGVTLLLINLSNSTSFDVTVSSDLNLYPPLLTESLASVTEKGQREEYHLTPQGGNIQSRVLLLNGQPLKPTSDGQIPEMSPFIADTAAPLHVAPYSIVFVRFKDFKAPACGNH